MFVHHDLLSYKILPAVLLTFAHITFIYRMILPAAFLMLAYSFALPQDTTHSSSLMFAQITFIYLQTIPAAAFNVRADSFDLSQDTTRGCFDAYASFNIRTSQFYYLFITTYIFPKVCVLTFAQILLIKNPTKAFFAPAYPLFYVIQILHSENRIHSIIHPTGGRPGCAIPLIWRH